MHFERHTKMYVDDDEGAALSPECESPSSPVDTPKRCCERRAQYTRYASMLIDELVDVVAEKTIIEMQVDKLRSCKLSPTEEKGLTEEEEALNTRIDGKIAMMSDKIEARDLTIDGLKHKILVFGS